jgi:hypothetical protein
VISALSYTVSRLVKSPLNSHNHADFSLARGRREIDRFLAGRSIPGVANKPDDSLRSPMQRLVAANTSARLRLIG